jgi:hypothetical protein
MPLLWMQMLLLSYAKMKYFIKSIAMVEAHGRQAHHPGGIIG